MYLVRSQFSFLFFFHARKADSALDRNPPPVKSRGKKDQLSTIILVQRIAVRELTETRKSCTYEQRGRNTLELTPNKRTKKRESSFSRRSERRRTQVDFGLHNGVYVCNNGTITCGMINVRTNAHRSLDITAAYCAGTKKERATTITMQNEQTVGRGCWGD